MTIDKMKFLEDLRMVQAGLSSKELLEQSSSFVFKDKTVFTFNDEIACRKSTDFPLEGAVRAEKLLKTLDKLPEDDKTLEVKENSDGQMEFRGRTKRFALAREMDVLLPIEKILEEVPRAWGPLPTDFGDIIKNMKDCVSTDEANHFALTCVHLHPDFIEACDTRQLLRWRVALGHRTSMLVRGTAISQIVGLGVSKISATASWIHFKHANGLIFSCRKFMEDYPNMDDVLNVKGTPVTLPKGIMKATEIAAIFAADIVQGIEPTVLISLRPGLIRIRGQGSTADFYEEIQKCNYKGPKIEFVMTPALLSHVVDTYNDAQLTDNKLKASGGFKEKVGLWDYVTVLGRPKPFEIVKGAEPEEEEEAPAKDMAPDEDDVPF